MGQCTELFMHELGTTAAMNELWLNKAKVIWKEGSWIYSCSAFPAEIATDYFSEVNKLGQGGFGPVYKVSLDFKGLIHFFNNIGILKNNKVVL